MSTTGLQFESSRGAKRENSGPAAPGQERKHAILLLADDLTGACDSGLEFLKAGHSVSVRCAASEADLSAVSADVLAISTETRNLTVDEAEKRLLHVARMHPLSASVLFQKVDSVGRGNAGAEMLTILRASGCDVVVYAPAFPAAGRTVSQGLLRITDVCGQNNELSLLTLIPSHARDRVQQIPVASESALRQSMLQAHNQGQDIWLCDARQQADLGRIARAASALPLRLLWTGSAGLAQAVAELTKAETDAAIPAKHPNPPSGCVIVFCGTTHPVTSLQMDRLTPHALALELDGTAALPAGGCGVVSLAWETATEQSVRAFWNRHQQPGSAPIHSLVLTGGDTAAFVLRSLDATSLRLGGEVEPGIPWGIVEDGFAAGCTVITKSGGFGREFSLSNAVDFCHHKVHA
jgi:uncharacterized protein YgbK (DUF1537 family)